MFTPIMLSASKFGNCLRIAASAPLRIALHRVVGVDDGALVVRNHHPRRDIVQRNLDPQGFVGLALGLGNFEAHAGLQDLQRLQGFADFVVARDVDYIGVVAADHVGKGLVHLQQRATDGAGKQQRWPGSQSPGKPARKPATGVPPSSPPVQLLAAFHRGLGHVGTSVEQQLLVFAPQRRVFFIEQFARRLQVVGAYRRDDALVHGEVLCAQAGDLVQRTAQALVGIGNRLCQCELLLEILLCLGEVVIGLAVAGSSTMLRSAWPICRPWAYISEWLSSSFCSWFRKWPNCSWARCMPSQELPTAIRPTTSIAPTPVHSLVPMPQS
jgi:hypothetical protein